MREPHFEHLPRSTAQLTSGIFSSAVMPCPQLGQRERGATRLSGGSCAAGWPASSAHCSRSEEHTSELQSPCNLVCRLLLEKKKKKPFLLSFKKKKKKKKKAL